MGKEKKALRRDCDPIIPFEGMPSVAKTSHNAHFLRVFTTWESAKLNSGLLIHGPFGGHLRSKIQQKLSGRSTEMNTYLYVCIA